MPRVFYRQEQERKQRLPRRRERDKGRDESDARREEERQYRRSLAERGEAALHKEHKREDGDREEEGLRGQMGSLRYGFEDSAQHKLHRRDNLDGGQGDENATTAAVGGAKHDQHREIDHGGDGNEVGEEDEPGGDRPEDRDAVDRQKHGGGDHEDEACRQSGQSRVRRQSRKENAGQRQAENADDVHGKTAGQGEVGQVAFRAGVEVEAERGKESVEHQLPQDGGDQYPTGGGDFNVRGVDPSGVGRSAHLR